MHVPTDLDIDLNKEIGDQECFVPKKCIHTWTGHTKAVNAIRFFPKHGHLLLSCSLDNSIRLWDVYHDRKCLRTFQGHNKSVKDITFSHDGKLFLSASYDKWIKLWNTETGQCISSFTTTKLPHVLKFNPLDSNVFLVGCQDRKVYQFDIRTGNIEMEYAQHIGPVNTITFLDENRRFITTSDDKSIRAWEYGSGVIVKYIAEPDMHSMPAVSLSWSRMFLLI